MRLRILYLAFLALAACGCGDRPGPETPEPLIPASYLELMRAYDAGRIFASAGHSSSSCTIRFEDGQAVTVPESDFKVHDCTGSSPAVIGMSGEWWTIDGTVMGIRKLGRTVPKEESLPVYAYFDSKTLRMQISNGEFIAFDSMALREEAEAEAQKARLQNIPVVKITTDGGAAIVDKKNYVKGTITVLDPEMLYSGEQEFSARMGIRGRGNSTWGWRKKPWKVKLEEKAPLLGMPKDKEWCLLANYADRTLLRNTVAMKISEICGFSWTPRMRSVEVYLNGRYQGVYNLCEHKKVSKDRVNISVVTEADNSGYALTGDYYLEMEENQDETTCWWTGMGVPMMFSDPEVPTEAQYKYMTGYLDSFEKALKGSDFADPEKGYAAYFDVQSLISYYIIQELTKNVDGNLRKSSFITKQRDRKMEMYHVWDFDLTLGNCGYLPAAVGNGPENFWIKDYGSDSRKGTGWYPRLFKDPAFVKALQQRWNGLMPELQKIPEFIDDQSFRIDKARRRNFQVWDISRVDPEMDWVKVSPKGSYEAEVQYLKDFYAKRLAWLDREINKL